MRSPLQSFLTLTMILCTCASMAASEPGMRKIQGETIYTDYVGQDYTVNSETLPEFLVNQPGSTLFISVTRLTSVANPKAAPEAFVIRYVEESVHPQDDAFITKALVSEAGRLCVRQGSRMVGESLIPTKDIQNERFGDLESRLRAPIRSYLKKRRILEIMFNCEAK